MLSEDYYGFASTRNKDSRPSHVLRPSRIVRRTELSSERLSSHSRENSRPTDEGIEHLKAKYANLNKKSRKKAQTGRPLSNKMTYQSLKMRYFHYNDQGGYDPHRELKLRTEEKALSAFKRNHSEDSEKRSKIVLELMSENQYLKNMIETAISDRNNYSQGGRVIAKFRNKVNSTSSLSSNRSANRFLPRLEAPDKSHAPKQAYLNIDADSDSSAKQGEDSCLSLGMNTLRKDRNPQEQPSSQHIPQPYSQHMPQPYSQHMPQPGSQLSDQVPFEPTHKQSAEWDNRHETSEISINSRQEDSPERISGDPLVESMSGLRDPNLITSDYERIKLLERRAQKSKVRILKYEEDSMQESSSNYTGTQPIAENSSYMRNTHSHHANNSGSSISNMIYASSKLFDEKRRREQEEARLPAEPRNGSFLRLESTHKPNDFLLDQEILEQPSFLLKDTQNIDYKFNEAPMGEYYHMGAMSPGPSRNLLNTPNTPKIYSNSRIIYNQSNVSPSLSITSNHTPVKPDIMLNRSSLDPRMPPIKESMLQSSSLNQNEELAATAKFNLLESMRLWGAYEENRIGHHFHQGEGGVLEKIDAHLAAVNWIADFVEETEEFYEDQQKVQFQMCSFLLYKMFYQERIKIVKCLRGELPPESCFNLTAKEITRQQLRLCPSDSLNELAADLEECNIMIWNSLQSFYWEARRTFHNNSLLSLENMKKEEIVGILELLSEEIELLLHKIDEVEVSEADSFEREHSRDALCWRSFRIMELVFLISELQGRKVKKLEDSIEPDDFEHYCKQYYGSFKQAVYYFN